MPEIENIHDKFFKWIFEKPGNAREFLKIACPTPLLDNIDLDHLEIDPNAYVSKHFKNASSDIVVKTKTKKADASGETLDTDIYILFEHKSYLDDWVLIQALRYILLMWEKDIAEKKPLRVIIPLVFYHGKKKWDIPMEFADQFDVDDTIKKYLLNYRYVLFDTDKWDFQQPENAKLKETVMTLSAIALMKSAVRKDIESTRRILEFWHTHKILEKTNKDTIIFFFTYIGEAYEIEPEKVIELFKETKKGGGDLMPTIAEYFRKEGRQEGEQIGRQEGKKSQQIESAKLMLKKGMKIEDIKLFTGLPDEEINALMH